MEEEMIKLCNIMPVELALKRELEYRKKIEALKNQRQNDLNPPIPAQGPPTPARNEDAELAPSNSQKSPVLQFSSSTQTFKEKPAFSCKACQLHFGSVFYLSYHIESPQHKVNISQMKMRREAISNPICCELCNSSSSSLGQIEAHLNGSRHSSLDSNSVPVSEGQTLFDRKRKFQPWNAQCSRTLSSSRSFRSSPRFVCVICRIAFATVFHLKIHGETLAHRAKVCKSKKEGENTSNPFLCEVCDILCSSSRVMEYHIAGIKHATFLQEFEHAKRQRIYGNLASNQ